MTKIVQEDGSDKTTICLLGASFDTGNLGVNALAESAIKIVLHRWRGARIVLFGNGYQPEVEKFSLAGEEVALEIVPVRFAKNLGLPYHFLWFALYGLLVKAIPGGQRKQRFMGRNPYCRSLYEAHVAVDITGGDSFSDIYGMHRFVLGFLRKWLVLLYGKRFIMLPQTYGPFHRRLTKVMAKYILTRAEAVYSRDMEGLEYLKHILNSDGKSKARFSPDVAFVLDPRAPEDPAIQPGPDLRRHGSVVVGLNVSGLLYNGGYTRDNMFDLKEDYREIVHDIAEWLLQRDEVVLLLVPHVFPDEDMNVESDPVACRRLFEEIRTDREDRVFLATGQYNHNEIKHVIGRCDLFLGSRMHSCIAALSQGIPAVGLAYSKKFRGVFDCVGMGDWVVDLRHSDHDMILDAVSRAFEQKEAVRQNLQNAVHDAQQRIMGMFDALV